MDDKKQVKGTQKADFPTKADKTKDVYDKFEDSCFGTYDYLGHSASNHEQTGLIPSLPQSENELESYQDLFPFMPHDV